MTVTCTTVALASGEDGWLLRYERTFGGRDSDHRLNLTVGPGWEYEVDETLVRGHPLRVQLFSTGPGEWSLFRYASTDTAEGVPASCSDGHLRCAARSLVQGLALFAVLYLAVDSVDDTLEDLNDQLAPEVDYTPTPIVLPADPPTTKE